MYLKSFLNDDKDLFILLSDYHGQWSPDCLILRVIVMII